LLVPIVFKKRSLAIAFTAASAIVICVAAGGQAAKPAASTGSPAIQLTPYTAPDQSASAGVPAGWQVTKGGQTVIDMTGPQGVTLDLGNTFVAQNGSFQAGKAGPKGTDLTMPASAGVSQKLIMIMQQNAVIAGKPIPQFTVASSTPIPFPANLGECGRMVLDNLAAQGEMRIMAVFCSFPVDMGGTFKSIVLMASAPAAVASESAPMAQAIFQSYRIPAAWLQSKLAPFHAPPAAKASSGSAAKTMQETEAAEAAANNSANCFDLTVLRSTPTALLPMSCRGL
jgi:hypothetical protein